MSSKNLTYFLLTSNIILDLKNKEKDMGASIKPYTRENIQEIVFCTNGILIIDRKIDNFIPEFIYRASFYEAGCTEELLKGLWDFKNKIFYPRFVPNGSKPSAFIIENVTNFKEEFCRTLAIVTNISFLSRPKEKMILFCPICGQRLQIINCIGTQLHYVLNGIYNEHDFGSVCIHAPYGFKESDIERDKNIYIHFRFPYK